MSTELKQRTVKVVLFQGDDLDRVEALDAAVEEAFAAVGQRKVGDPTPGIAEAETRDAFVAEATDRAITVILRPLGRKTWRKMLNDNLPREGNEQDKELGFNEETLADDLVPASIGSPIFESEEARDAFLDSLSHGQYQRIYSEAYRLNANFGPSPLVGLSTRLARMSAGTSESSDGPASD